MSEERETSTQGLVGPSGETAADFTPLIPLADKWLDGTREDARLKHEIQQQELSAIREANKRTFSLLLIIIGIISAIAASLIFLKDEVGSGLLVLSHVGAVVAGLLAGMGFERTRPSLED